MDGEAWDDSNPRPGDVEDHGGGSNRQRQRQRQRQLRRMAVGVVVVVVGVAAWAVLGPSPAPDRSTGPTVSGFFQARRDGDCERLLGLLTEASWSQEGRLSRDEFLAQCAEATDGNEPTPQQVAVEIVDDEDGPAEDGDRAVVRWHADQSPSAPEGHLVWDDGRWKVETDPHVLRLGRSAEATVQGYVDTYNTGDCELMLDYLSEAVWTEDGELTEEQFVEQCTAAAAARAEHGQQPLMVEVVRVTEHGEGATTTVELVDALRLPPDLGPSLEMVTLVRLGLEWRLDRIGQRPPLSQATTYVELQARLLDAVQATGELCSSYRDSAVERGVRRDFGCADTCLNLTLRQFADDAEARSHAPPLAGSFAVAVHDGFVVEVEVLCAGRATPPPAAELDTAAATVLQAQLEQL